MATLLITYCPTTNLDLGLNGHIKFKMLILNQVLYNRLPFI